jgi:hypothetical protein
VVAPANNNLMLGLGVKASTVQLLAFPAITCTSRALFAFQERNRLGIQAVESFSHPCSNTTSSSHGLPSRDPMIGRRKSSPSSRRPTTPCQHFLQEARNKSFRPPTTVSPAITCDTSLPLFYQERSQKIQAAKNFSSSSKNTPDSHGLLDRNPMTRQRNSSPSPLPLTMTR